MLKVKYLPSMIFSTTSCVWAARGWLNQEYGHGLLLYGLAYFLREMYLSTRGREYQYVIHGAIGAGGVVSALIAGPALYRDVYVSTALFEFTTPFLNIAKSYRTPLSYRIFAGVFFGSRIVMGTYYYVTEWYYATRVFSTALMILQYFWMYGIYLKSKEVLTLD